MGLIYLRFRKWWGILICQQPRYTQGCIMLLSGKRIRKRIPGNNPDGWLTGYRNGLILWTRRFLPGRRRVLWPECGGFVAKRSVIWTWFLIIMFWERLSPHNQLQTVSVFCWWRFRAFLKNDFCEMYPGACLKNHFRHLHSPIRMIFTPDSGYIVLCTQGYDAACPRVCALHLAKISHVMPFRIQIVKYIMPFRVHLTESIFKTCSGGFQMVPDLILLFRKWDFQYLPSPGRDL